MNSKKNLGSSVVLKPNTNIGSVAAEEDQFFLSNCFVETSNFEAICDMDSSKCVLLGRTGAGKSAIIQKLLADKKHCVSVDPQSLSLNYIAN